MTPTTPSLSWLTDPTVFAVNRLPAHSDHRWTVGGEEWRQSLCGDWRFAYSPNPDARPADFFKPEADLSAFGSIQVPGHIETQGYGQLQYVNTQYPWDGHTNLRPPEIDWQDCPVGSYVRDFTLDESWLGRRVCVSFQGVETAFYLYCNGAFVGYSEDSFTPADFDLTAYLHAGVNRLCAEVYKRCSGSWLEDQDMFRFSGIFRPVFLYAKPAVHIEDLWLRAGLADDNTTGTLAPRLRLSAAAGASAEGVTLACSIAAPGGAEIFSSPLALHAEGEDYMAADPIALPAIRPWRHEDPALYTVALVLCDANGAELETVRYKTGFRRFALIDGVMRLNGERIYFNGVNRHEWNPAAGRAIGPEDMRRAIETFKAANINAVRTCHYPNQSLWYDLCDEAGIYMIDETNLESHGTWQKRGAIDPDWNVPGSKPEWLACVLDRARSMFERDKNHTAVLFWSCGNESYAGADILAMSEFFRENDPSRLVHYEGVHPCRQNPGYDPAWERISDVESRMYAHPEEIRAYLEAKPAKPFILCEYMHDMGNSLGGMESYTVLGDEFEQYQGGFIWDYMDQALWHTDALGRRALGYGGDFGERPADYAFSANGIVFADGKMKPAVQDVRHWHLDKARRDARDAANARAAAEAAQSLAAAEEARRKAGEARGDLRYAPGDVNFGVAGDGFEILFSWTEHGPASLRVNGAEWLYRAPRPVFWRAATENDKGCGFPARSAAWLAAEACANCTGDEIVEQGPRRCVVVYHFGCAATPGMRADLRYTVEAEGTLTIEAVYHGAPGLPELPCFGVRLSTPTPVEEVAWRGLSGETYPDRYKGADFGSHRETPHIPAYLVPQDCGCHIGTQSLTLRRKNAFGGCEAALSFVMDGAPFAFSALPNTALELEAADHREDLPAAPHTQLCLYAAMRGVGGIDSWYSDVEAPYHVSGEEDHAVSVKVRL